MVFFDKFFGKKQDKNITKTNTAQFNEGDKFISTDNKVAYKVLRDLTNEQVQRIEESTLLLRTGQLYMHYWTDNLICTDKDDKEWQNKVMFFWKAEEPFPNKSLPPIFETFKIKHFLFEVNTSFPVKVSQAMPWFGMPGLGEKHVCEINGEKITIPELYKLGKVEYFEQVELSNKNFDILKDKENYFFLIDERITPFINGNFNLEGHTIPINVAYSIGGIQIIKKTELE